MLPDNTEGTLSGSTDASAEPVVLEELPNDNAAEVDEQDSDTGAGVTEPPKSLPDAAAVVVPLADRQRWEYRCKICQLATKYPTIYVKLHDLILKDKRSYNSSLAEVNAYIHQHRIRVHDLNMMNVLSHFKKHIGIETQVQLALSRQDLAPPMTPQARASQQAIQPMIDEAVGDDVDDFNNLNEVRVRVTNVLRRLETQLDVIDPRDGHTRLDKFALQSFVALTSETRACINDLNKMRQSERLLNTVVQSLLEKLVYTIIPQLLEEYKVIVKELRDIGVAEDNINRIDLKLRTKTAEIIANTARGAVLEVQRQFKLR